MLQSANLRATPWNIAVNAIMAGCRPMHMPLLIAAVKALGDERCSLNNIGNSSGIFPFVLVNDPLAKQLGIESGAQTISRGANPAIGRAIGLIVRNIAGYSKQDVKRHVYEHTCMRLADFDWVLKYTNINPTTARKRAEQGVFPPEFLGNPDDLVRVLSSPDILHIGRRGRCLCATYATFRLGGSFAVVPDGGVYFFYGGGRRRRHPHPALRSGMETPDVIRLR